MMTIVAEHRLQTLAVRFAGCLLRHLELAELAMIDENLCRNDLSPSERAEATARRKEILKRAAISSCTLRRSGEQLSSAAINSRVAKLAKRERNGFPPPPPRPPTYPNG